MAMGMCFVFLLYHCLSKLWWNGRIFGASSFNAGSKMGKQIKDAERKNRLKAVNDSMKLYRCHSIMNCTRSCPKGLNPAKAIADLKKAIVTEL